MRHILELCVDAEELARHTYGEFARNCRDETTASVFRAMGRDEETHVEWWMSLVEQWDRGLLPDIFAETEGVRDEMLGVVADVRRIEVADYRQMGTRDMLEVAGRLEFFLLDPVFGDLLDLGGPATAQRHRAAYEEHLDRLFAAIETRSERGDLAAFLARVLRRTWESNRAREAAASTHDPLTGMVNRNALLAHLDPWANWSARYGHPLGVMLIDVDHLARINQDYGQGYGDRVLAEVGDVIRRSMRTSDLLARYGGDEFIALLPEADVDEVRSVAERVLSLVRGLAVPSASVAQLPVSVSIGSAIVADPRGAAPRPVDEDPGYRRRRAARGEIDGPRPRRDRCGGLALGALGGVAQLARVVAAAHERRARHRREAEFAARRARRLANTSGVDELRDRQVLGARPQVLPEREQVARRRRAGRAITSRTSASVSPRPSMRPDFVGSSGRRSSTRASTREAAAVVRAGTHLGVQARDGLDVVVEDVGARVRDGVHRRRGSPPKSLVSTSTRASGTASRSAAIDRHEVRRAAVGQVVAGHRGDDDVLEPIRAAASARRARLVRVERLAARGSRPRRSGSRACRRRP